MSAATQLFDRKLANLVATVDVSDFLHVVWQVRKLQTGGGLGPLVLHGIPEHFITQDIKSNLYLHPWRLETLVNLILIGSEQPVSRQLDLRYLPAFLKLYDVLHKLENAQDGDALGRNHIFLEMYRLT